MKLVQMFWAGITGRAAPANTHHYALRLCLLLADL
jgi:hypothetical protein